VTWLVGGVTFWAEVDPGNHVAENNEYNNVGGRVTKALRAGEKLRIAWVALPYAPANSSPLYPDQTIAATGARFMQRIYPVGVNDVEYFQQPTQRLKVITQTFSSDNALNYLSALNRFWKLTTQRKGWVGGQAPDRLYAWIPKEAYSNLCGIADARFAGLQGRVAAGMATSSCGGTTLAHELGHTLNEQGLRHAPN
jgi:hypothetical protein